MQPTIQPFQGVSLVAPPQPPAGDHAATADHLVLEAAGFGGLSIVISIHELLSSLKPPAPNMNMQQPQALRPASLLRPELEFKPGA